MATETNGAELVLLSLSETENHIGSASMHPAASSNLLRTDSSTFKRLAKLESQVSRSGFHREIALTLRWALHSARSLANLAESLVSIADHAYATRQFEIVGQAGQLLSGLQLSRQVESAGHYYQALAFNQGCRGDTVRAGQLFEQVADDGSLQYRARAMLALGGISFVAGDARTAMSFYREVHRVLTRSHTFAPVALFGGSKMAAVMRGMDGDHQGAVADLEKMFRLARMAGRLQPYLYYDYLNALAVELGESGSLEQARRASEIALASPFAPAYPEWRETFDEIGMKQRCASPSVVPVRRQIEGSHNLLRLPEPEWSASATPLDRNRQRTPARVLDFQRWKTMSRGASNPLPDKLAPEQRKRMTTGAKLIRLMDLISHDETDDETIDRILEAVEQIVPKRRSENLD
jgi:tetratricopeptide (TPR) repeat protein